MVKPMPPPELVLLTSPDWVDYELLDSGGGAKLERYGVYTFVRPEHQAVWQPALPPDKWKAAHAIFQSTGEESGGRWQFNRPVEPSWNMQYKGLKIPGSGFGFAPHGGLPRAGDSLGLAG